MPKLPESLLSLTEEITAPILPEADIAALSSLVNASPEEFQKAAARVFRRLAIEGFRTIQAPRNYKELSTVVDLWRKLEGIDKADKGQAMPVGLVGVLRGVSRRVIEAEEVGEEVGFE